MIVKNRMTKANWAARRAYLKKMYCSEHSIDSYYYGKESESERIWNSPEGPANQHEWKVVRRSCVTKEELEAEREEEIDRLLDREMYEYEESFDEESIYWVPR